MSKFEIFYPLKPFIVTQPFGTNGEYYRANAINIIGHNGLDLKAIRGQEVRASHDGIAYIGIDSREGHGVVIQSNNKFNYNNEEVYMKTIYWHLLPNIYIENGQKVLAGDLIGYADSTGFSTGDHLHFGLKPGAPGENSAIWYNTEQDNGYFGSIDPLPFFYKYHAQDAQVVLSILLKIKELLSKVANLLSSKL